MAKDARTERRWQDCGNTKANGDEPGLLCLDNFFDCEQSDCVEKSVDTQCTLSNRFRETWRKRSQSRRSVEFSRMAKRCICGRKYRETCRDGRRPGTPELSSRCGEYRETCRPRKSRKSRKLWKLGNRRQWRRLPHNLHISTNYVEKVFSIVRQRYCLSPTDQMKNLDVNTATWRKFVSVTLQAAVHLGKDCTENLRSTKNQPLKSWKQLFKVTERLIADQTEITGLTTIDWQQPMWRETTLSTDRAVQFATAKTCVFSDSGIRDEPVKACESRIKWSLETRYLKDLDRIDGEPMEFEWKNVQGFTRLGIIAEIQKMMVESKCEPVRCTKPNYHNQSRQQQPPHKQTRNARAGALMAHHPAWVGHHTGTVHPCPLRWGGCGLLTGTPTHNNESKKTQHNNNIVAEQVFCDLSVRSVVRFLGAQVSVCPWSVQMFLMWAIGCEAMTSPLSRPARKHCSSASLGSARTRWSATTRSWQRDAGGTE